MQTICELRSFRRAAAQAGMSDGEVLDLILYLAANPMAGEEIVGTGGCRKLRWSGRNKGKRGGYRAITFFSGKEMPVFLVTLFGKGERADLTQRERNALRLATKELVGAYAKKVRKAGQ